MNATKPAGAHASTRESVRGSAEVRDAIRRRSVSVYARTRVADAIRSLAFDICGGEDWMSANDRARLIQWITAPVNEATEEALRVLVDELASAIADANPRLRPTMLASVVSRTDFE